MLKVAFVLAALLATEGAVFSRPVSNARGYGPSDIVPRAELSIIQRRASSPSIVFFPTEDLYNQVVDSLEPLKEPDSEKLTVTATVATRDLSDHGDIETRGYWDEDEYHLARRELDDELMERDYDEGVLVPRRRGAVSKANRAARRKEAERQNAERLARLEAEHQAKQHEAMQHEAMQPSNQAQPYGNTGTAKEPQGETAQPGQPTAGGFWEHPHVQAAMGHPLGSQALSHPWAQKVLNTSIGQKVALNVLGRFGGAHQPQQ